jgi:acetoin utilization protein AcuB
MTNNTKQLDFKNLTIDGFTTPCPITVFADDSISSVILKLEENIIRHLPVVNEENVAVGVITDRDIATIKSFAFKTDFKVKDLMSEDPICVPEGMNLMEAAFTMSSKKLGSLIVTNSSGDVSGIFTNTDALNALVEVLRGEILESDL